MNRHLDDLNGDIVADIESLVHRQRDLRQAESARIRVPRWSGDLKGWDHGVGGVEDLGWVEFVPKDSHIDVEEGGGMALEPAGLYGDCTAFDGP